MNVRQAASSGYTIIETMIFLAVSSALFISVVLLVSGQQRRTEFAQAVRDLQSRITDIQNDVATGHYFETSNFTCDTGTLPMRPAAPPVFDPSTDADVVDGGSLRPRAYQVPESGSTPGKNDECMFIGQGIQFNPQAATEGNTMRAYSIMGRRLDPQLPERPVEDIHRALPTSIHCGSRINTCGFTDPGGSLNQPLSFSLKFSNVTYKDSAGDIQNICGFGFFTSLNSADAVGRISGSTSTNVIPFHSGNYSCGLHKDPLNNLHQRFFLRHLHNAMVEDWPTARPSPINPPSGIVICIRDNGNDQYALLTLGGANSGGNNLEILSGDAAALEPVRCVPPLP